MARFASNKNAFGYSERSGFRYKLKDMRKEWNGLTVGYDEYDSKQGKKRKGISLVFCKVSASCILRT